MQPREEEAGEDGVGERMHMFVLVMVINTMLLLMFSLLFVCVVCKGRMLLRLLLLGIAQRQTQLSSLRLPQHVFSIALPCQLDSGQHWPD